MYFLKPNGVIIEYNEFVHDLNSLKERFVECDILGNKIKPKPKAKPKAKKKDK